MIEKFSHNVSLKGQNDFPLYIVKTREVLAWAIVLSQIYMLRAI